MQKAEVVTELGQLIDCSEEEFRKYCEDKDLGYISSLLNLMTATYNEVSKVRAELVEKYSPLEEKAPDPVQREGVVETLNGLYSKLMTIEQRVFILREAKELRQLPPVPFSMPS